MINQLRNSYKFWNHPVFTKPKGAIRPPQTKIISYKQATHFRDFAESYFSSESVDQNEIRLRKPPGEVADITSIASHPFEAIQIASEEKNNIETTVHHALRNISISLQYRILAYLIKNKEYDKLTVSLEKVKKQFIMPSSIILPIYGYIASICQGLEDEENKYIQSIEQFQIDQSDQKHFYHLLDELFTLSYSYQCPTLLHLLIGDTNDVASSFLNTPHVLPILTTNNHLSIILRANGQVFDHLSYVRYQAALNLPKLTSDDDQEEEKETL